MTEAELKDVAGEVQRTETYETEEEAREAGCNWVVEAIYQKTFELQEALSKAAGRGPDGYPNDDESGNDEIATYEYHYEWWVKTKDEGDAMVKAIDDANIPGLIFVACSDITLCRG